MIIYVLISTDFASILSCFKKNGNSLYMLCRRLTTLISWISDSVAYACKC